MRPPRPQPKLQFVWHRLWIPGSRDSVGRRGLIPAEATDPTGTSFAGSYPEPPSSATLHLRTILDWLMLRDDIQE